MMAARRAAIPRKVRQAVWARDEGQCRKCGITDADAMGRDGEHLHFDHVIPWSKGGTDTADNLQLLCGPCNRAKSDSLDPLTVRPAPAVRVVSPPLAYRKHRSHSYGKYGSPLPPLEEKPATDIWLWE
jgi:5-methylcytosine-specific restriction endonuclease McrA